MNNYIAIPEELKNKPQWVCWSENKIPRNPNTGTYASSTDSRSWGSFKQAVAACEIYNFDGIGFVFSKEDEYFGVDLDHCIDNRELMDEFVDTLKSYTEISRSGSGIHIICKGTLPTGGRRCGGIEMYSENRYFIFTGNLYNKQYRKITDCTEKIKPLYNKYFPSVIKSNRTSVIASKADEIEESDDDSIIRLAMQSKTGTLFSLLYSGYWESVYSSQSEADLAFCNYLAYWTGCNPVAMDRLFKKSGLMRDKWIERRGDKTYGDLTIGKAILGCTSVYDPVRRRSWINGNNSNRRANNCDADVKGNS